MWSLDTQKLTREASGEEIYLINNTDDDDSKVEMNE